MGVEVKLEEIVEALEMAGDTSLSFLDVETGEVSTISEEEVHLAEDPDLDMEELPEWQRAPVELARDIEKFGEKRYLELPDKVEIHEWEIMRSFTLTLADPRMQKEFDRGIHGGGAFRIFKGLLDEYKLWDAWNSFRQIELRRIAVEWCEENGVSYRESSRKARTE